jgi:N-acetylglucosamine malate deacetylase 1
LKEPRKVLFLAPHPDDETLGCGGTILKHRSQGDKVFWVIMTSISTEDGYDGGRVEQRRREIARVTQEYGFEKVYEMDYQTVKLDVVPKAQLVEAVSAVFGETEPDTAYVPNRSDIHSDHRITFEAVMSAAKTFRHPSLKKILMYETLSETEFAPSFQSDAFVPNSFVDVSLYFQKKIDIMKIYESELKARPFPRSIENLKALAAFRGATAGVSYAEAFTLLRDIW